MSLLDYFINLSRASNFCSHFSMTSTEEMTNIEIKRSDSKTISIYTSRALVKGEAVMTIQPVIKLYYLNERGEQRCHCCGIVVPSFILVQCLECSAAFYCSTMCLVRHRSRFHHLECGFLRQWVETYKADLSPLGLMLARMLIYFSNDPATRNDLNAIKSTYTSVTLGENELCYIRSVFNPRDVKFCQKLLDCHLHPLYDAQMNTVGTFFEPLFSIIGHSCTPSLLMVPLSSETFDVVCCTNVTASKKLSVSKIPISQPRLFRQIQLFQQFGLSCDCPLCKPIAPDLFLSFVCPRCKLPIYEIVLDDFAGSSELESRLAETIQRRCSRCGKIVKKDELIETKRLYQGCLQMFLQVGRLPNVNQLSLKTEQMFVGRLMKSFKATPHVGARSKAFARLLKQVKRSSLIAPYCFPLNYLYRSLAENPLIMSSTLEDTCSEESLILLQLYILFHVHLALDLPHMLAKMLPILRKAEILAWDLLQLSMYSERDITRIDAKKARLFFKVQASALLEKLGRKDSKTHSLAQLLGNRPQMFDDDVRRSAERALLKSGVKIKKCDDGYHFRLANNEDIMAMIPFRECLQYLRWVGEY